MENKTQMYREENYPFPTVEELKAELPEGDPTRLYLDEIGHLKLFSEAEEQMLARQMLEGSEEAREKLIEHNLMRVVFIALQYRNRGMNILDLIEEGNNGLLRAAKAYREMEKYPFFAFAAWHIHLAIHMAFQMSNIEMRPYPFIYERIDSERVRKDPCIYWEYMEMPRRKYVENQDWTLITLIFGFNGGRMLTKREILDLTEISSDRLRYIVRQVLRTGIVRRQRNIKDFYDGVEEENQK